MKKTSIIAINSAKLLQTVSIHYSTKPTQFVCSYYFNPLTDAPGSAEDRAKYPLSYPENIWPAPSDVPEFEEQAKALGSLMREVVVLLAKHIDRFAASFYPDYEADYLFNQMATTEKAKGRLLYYFPLSAAEIAEGVSEDSWIGWHNDSGFLTALAGDMYVDEATGEQVPCPDPEAGLYVTTRDGTSTKVNIPSECMAVQIGECVQIITGGKIVATPHCVKGAKVAGVGRISFPLFIDTAPNVELKMPLDCTRDDVFAAAIPNDKVPALDSRWKNGQSFGEFLDATFNVYYKK